MRVELENGLPVVRWNPVVEDNATASHYECEGLNRPIFVGWDSVVASCGSESTGGVPNQLLSAGRYYLRVRALFGSGVSPSRSDWSPVIAFDYDPNASALAAPTGLAFHTDFGEEFSWKPVKYATAYRFEASYSPDFDTLIDSVVTPANAHIPILSHYTESLVYWRVAALNAECKQSAWAASDTVSPSPVPLPGAHLTFLPFISH